MKYFIELLESYSKLKKRKLKLLQEKSDVKRQGQARGTTWKPISDDAKSKANFWIGQAIQAGNQKVPVTDIGGEIWVAEGGDNPGAIYYNGFQGGVQKKICNKGETGNCRGAIYSEFAKKFEVKEDQPKEPSAEKAAQQGQPQNQGGGVPQMQPPPLPQVISETNHGSVVATFFNGLIASTAADPNTSQMLAQMGQEAVSNISEASKLAGRAFEYLKTLTGAAAKFMKRESAAVVSNYLFGASPQSLESKVSKTRYKLKSFDDGSFQVEDGGSIAPEDLLSYTKLMRDFFEIFKPDGTPIKDKINKNIKFLKNKFNLNSDGSVTIHLDDDKEKSIVIKETSTSKLASQSDKGLLRFILEAVETQFEKTSTGTADKFTEIDIREKSSAGFNNNIRGTLLEKILIFNTLIRRMTEAKDPEEKKRWQAIIQDNLDIDKKFRENLKVLRELNEEWTYASQEAAVPTEDYYFNASLTDLFGNDSLMLFRSVEVIASDERRKKPFTMVHVGKETGPGEKADAIEIHLRDPGGESSLELAGAVPQLESYIKNGLLLPDQPVYVRRVDYKHYMDSSKGVTFNVGSSTRNSTFELARQIQVATKSGEYRRGIFVGEKRSDRSQLIRKNNSNLIGGKDSVSELANFVTEIEKVISRAGKISSNNINSETLETRDVASEVAEALLSTFRKNFSQSDLQRDNIFSSLQRRAEAYAEETNEEEKKILADKLSKAISASVTSLSIKKALDGKNSKLGKNMLITILNSAAGSTQKGAVSINRVISPNQSREYEYRRGVALEYVIASLKDLDTSNIKFNGTDFTIKDQDGSNLASVEFDVSKDRYVVYFDEKFIRDKIGIQPSITQYRTKKDFGMELPTKTESSNALLNVLIKNQVKLLETLMKLEKESVGK